MANPEGRKAARFVVPAVALGILAAVTGAKARQTAPVAPAAPVAPLHLALTGEQTQGGWVRGTLPAGARGLTLDGKPVPVAPDGSWFAAFDRDAGPVATFAVTRADGSVRSEAVAVAPRQWKLEHVNIARRSGGPSEAFMKIRRPELARIAAARAMVTDAQGWR